LNKGEFLAHRNVHRSEDETANPTIEGTSSKRLGSRYRSGRSLDWLKMKNPAAPAVQREAEEDWGRR
jgi:ATP-dependent DNA ligase